ncbi:MAG: hypothetical protein OIF56_14860 [Cohaesibacter sp.]|nr:hypothetical protein [Cohaesibacter sp.]
MRIASIYVLAGFMALICLASLANAGPRTVFNGPALVPAEVERVYDADTIYVKARVWLKTDKAIGVRISGVDTPEKRGSGCRSHPLWRGKKLPNFIKAYENDLGLKATDFVKKLIKPGDWLILSDVKPDKYQGRVVAEAHYAPNQKALKACLAYPYDLTECPSLGPDLIKTGHAVEYTGGTKAAWWCEGPSLQALPKPKLGQGD